MNTPVKVIQVVDVYGVKLHIAKEDLAGPRTQIPIRNRFGVKLSDTRRGQRMIRRGDGTTIHRDNITGQANAHFLTWIEWQISIAEVPFAVPEPDAQPRIPGL